MSSPAGLIPKLKTRWLLYLILSPAVLVGILLGLIFQPVLYGFRKADSLLDMAFEMLAAWDGDREPIGAPLSPGIEPTRRLCRHGADPQRCPYCYAFLGPPPAGPIDPTAGSHQP